MENELKWLLIMAEIAMVVCAVVCLFTATWAGSVAFMLLGIYANMGRKDLFK